MFYIFSALALLCGVFVIVGRNPVNSAMFLVLTILSLAGLFVLLHAFFLAAVQIIVYAGAVIVLFLFVIMLLDLKEEQRRKIKVASVGLGVVSVAAIGGLFWRALSQTPLSATSGVEGGPLELGRILFSSYTLPFEILSVLLLVAMVGVILISKKDLK
ncbi:MAG TPA: NADH-quinone oxidoreductase subunit J [Verrucomicrobiae bacterium]|nr:NADH-quinone oxidoreductase subunit J [Verrucomicrobiae bacterium]